MVMPASGPLNMGGTSSPVSVAQELGLSLTATISMNDAAVRNLAGVGGSGTTWSMNSLYGKSNTYAIEYLVVGGGAARGAGGGAGAGGYVATTGNMAPGTAYTVVVGAGGNSFAASGVGSPSSFNSSNAGGGNSQGIGPDPINPTTAGGSGCGAWRSAYASGSNYAGGGVGLTNSGGNFVEASTGGGPNNEGAGGGGGAGSAGGSGGASQYYANGGTGGSGVTWLNGVAYAGGGGGSAHCPYWCVNDAASGGSGGSGGGGGGGVRFFNSSCTQILRNPSDGAANRGGGGGGSAPNNSGSSGGSGIVVISYPGAQRGTGGTVSVVAGFTHHIFTSSGTYNV